MEELSRSAISIVLAVIFILTILQTYSPLGVSTLIHPASQYTLSKPSSNSNNTNYTTSLFKGNLTVPNGSLQKHIRVNPVKTSLENSNIKLFSTNSRKQKVSHIGFLKVFKAGSTTLARIFFRFGLKYDLTFALPKEGYQFTKTKSAMPVRPGNHRDILACHSVYSRTFFRSLLPEDSVNIGIIREPSERMISAAYYYRDVWKVKYLLEVPKSNFIHNLINRPDLYETKPFSHTKNAMGHVFGFSPTITVNDTEEIKKHLNLLKNDFKQVLVMERFEESLILMKRTLNWDLEDVVYLRQNSHAHQPEILNPSEHKKLKSTCFLDYAVYKAFYEIFDKKMADEGPDFINEVEHFKSVLQLVKDFCELIPVSPTRRSLRILKSAWNKPFQVTKQDCHFMQMGPFKLYDYLKRRHKQMNTNLGIMLKA